MGEAAQHLMLELMWLGEQFAQDGVGNSDQRVFIWRRIQINKYI